MRREKRTPSVIAVVLGLLVLSGALRADLTDGLVAHWAFDEGSGDTAYDSAGSNDGFIYGAQWAGGALTFDGANDYVDMGDSVKSDLGTSYTISAWIKADDVVANNVIAAYRQSSLSNPSVLFQLDHYDADARFIVRDDSGNIAQVICSNAITAGIWYHVAGMRDGDTLNLYVNGVSVGSETQTFGTINSNNLKVGAHQFGGNPPGAFFGGTIDDVRIYDRSLSGGEIEELYQETLPVFSGLEIAGPPEIAENFKAQYKAIAHYDNGYTADVTGLSVWSVDDETIASIDAGLLTTGAINVPQDITIMAEYTEGENTQEAQKQVSIFTTCPSGRMLDFDGIDDYVLVPDSPHLNPSSAITIMGWIKPTIVNKFRVISKDNILEGQRDYLLQVTETAGIKFVIWTPERVLIEGGTVTAGEWQHVAGTYDGTMAKAYIDGILVKGTIFSGVLADTDASFLIGDYREPFDGAIDDVRVYDRALSGEEIRAIVHTRVESSDPNLVGYWDFDEGEGQVVNDISGNGNDGTLGSTAEADDSDPVWIDSDAPVGICTAKGLVERNLLRVWDIKETILELLEDAIVTEDATKGFLDELFESGEMGEFKKNDVAKVKKKIHSAIQEEEQASTAVDKSVEKLEDALDALDIE